MAEETDLRAEAIAQQKSHHHHGIPGWLEREEIFLRILLRVCVGPVVAIAPWSPILWDRNPLLHYFPIVGIWAANGAVRGLITGLGLLNLWFALRETLHGKSRPGENQPDNKRDK
jgi:hypothetical protein